MPAKKKDAAPVECRVCGSQRAVHTAGRLPYHQTVGGVVFRTELPAVVCSSCNERLVTADVLGQFELAVARWFATSGLAAVDGNAFRFMRKAIGLPAQDLARILDVAPETVSRWEHNKLSPIDAKAIMILGLAVEDAIVGRATVIKRLREMASQREAPLRRRAPSSGPRRVRLDIQREAG